MDRDSANQISELIRLHSDEMGEFHLEETLDAPLAGFHKWADYRECVGAYRIETIGGPRTALYILLIEWNPRKHPDRFYLVVYRSARSRGPVYEIHKVRNGCLIWHHMPRKQDGRNSERKERFSTLSSQAGLLVDSHVEVDLPQNAADLADFLRSIFRLAKIRDEADDLGLPIRIDPVTAAEAVFKAANASDCYAAKRQKTGFQLQYDGKPAGGWEEKSHWYVLNPFASSMHDSYEAILRRFGFKQQKRHRWWKLRGEAEATSFCRALVELTGKPISLALPGEEQFGSYAEGLVEKVYVNRYERDSRNREAAIKKHGTRCFGCDLEMRDTYGEIADGFIHVHHTKPLSKAGGCRTPDLDDLIPLCPNCHAVVHLQDPPLSREQLRMCIGSNAGVVPLH
ncbi:MAG: HNH endonuclease [Gammaproteobacteria bacterium]|nr:HNH endonuclease [Gammaproteobacteria bacterium]